MFQVTERLIYEKKKKLTVSTYYKYEEKSQKQNQDTSISVL